MSDFLQKCMSKSMRPEQCKEIYQQSVCRVVVKPVGTALNREVVKLPEKCVFTCMEHRYNQRGLYYYSDAMKCAKACSVTAKVCRGVVSEDGKVVTVPQHDDPSETSLVWFIHASGGPVFLMPNSVRDNVEYTGVGMIGFGPHVRLDDNAGPLTRSGSVLGGMVKLRFGEINTLVGSASFAKFIWTGVMALGANINVGANLNTLQFVAGGNIFMALGEYAGPFSGFTINTAYDYMAKNKEHQPEDVVTVFAGWTLQL